MRWCAARTAVHVQCLQTQAQDLFSQGREAINAGNAAGAVGLLTQSILKDAGNNRLAERIGHSWDWSDSFNTCLACPPAPAAISHRRAFALRARALVLQKKPNAAIRDASHALSLNPDSYIAFKWRGKAHALLGNWFVVYVCCLN